MPRGSVRTGADALSRLMVEIRGDLSQTAAAREANRHLPDGHRRLTQSKLSRAEEGRTPLSPDEADAFARGCGSTDEQRERFVGLARDHAEITVRSRAAVARNPVTIQARIARLERDTDRVRAWQDNLVLGELQTSRYRTGVLGQDPGESWLAARAVRDRQFREPGREWHLLMFEGALRWALVSYEVMAEQIDSLAAAIDLPGVTLGIVDQYAVKPFAAPPSAFHIYGHTTAVVPGPVFHEDPVDVARHERWFDTLAGLALYGADARDLLNALARHYRERAG